MKTQALKALSRMLAMLALAGFTQLASAGLISFSPTPALGNVGDVISLDLLWTGGPGEYIGDFDVDIFLNTAIASPSVVFHDPDSGLDSLQAGIYGAGLIPGGFDTFGISLDAPLDLMANQDSLGNTFRLARIDFLALSEGQTAVTFGQTSFGDENGNPIAPQLSTGLICVGRNGCADVPEPASLALFSLGLAGLGWSRRKRA